MTVLREIGETFDREPRVLIVCPNSVKGVWDHHLDMIYPGAPRTIMGNTDHRGAVVQYEAGFLVVHWDALRIVGESLARKKWDAVIADEAHYAKNRKAQRTKALKKIKAPHKRALTGTPMVNRPDELWSILNWLWPKEFTSYWRFYEKFCNYAIHPRYGFRMFKGAKNPGELHALLRSRMVRRRKEEVLPDLPEKYHSKIVVPMAPKQRKAYDEMKEYSLTIVEPNTPIAAPVVLAQLTRLRQFADAYCMVGWETPEDKPVVTMTEPSPKLDALEDIIGSSDRPIVVFSMFKQMIRLASARLSEVIHEVMTGDTAPEDRVRIIEQFQRGDVRVLLATIQTGGIGITLTAADTAVFLDRSWSPADNRQAEDRLHRIGQENAVQVIHIESENTVDQVVEEKLAGKAMMFRDIIEGGGWVVSIRCQECGAVDPDDLDMYHEMPIHVRTIEVTSRDGEPDRERYPCGPLLFTEEDGP